jgi:hypothetical protein
VRLEKDEATDERFADWFTRRRYLSDRDPHDEASCAADATGARVTLRVSRPGIGSPELLFDLETGTLLAATNVTATGTRSGTFFGAWSPADANGVRWPAEWSERPEVGSLTRSRVTANEAGLQCAPRAPGWPTAPSCTSPFSPRFTLNFPPEGGAVRLPLAYYLGELALKIKVGGRDVWALLDSGAELTAIDATTPTGAAFVPALTAEGAAATQKVRMGLGEVESIGIGKLTAAHSTVVSVPIPALDSYGDKRPDVILGYPLFLAAAIRIDYAKNELTIAKTGALLHTARAQALPVTLLGGIVAAKATIEGKDALLQLDTGNGGPLSLNRAWTDANGIPGARPTKQLRGLFGAGEEATTLSLVRLANAQLGPIAWDGRVASYGEAPASGFIAGLVGNRVFSRCAAMVWDLPARTVWFEPPCDRPSPDQLAGWRLDRKEDPKHEGRPWVVSALVDGAAASNAGVAVGDRILEVDGNPATRDRRFESATERPAGTKVPVSLLHEGVTKRVVLDLTLVP